MKKVMNLLSLALVMAVFAACSSTGSPESVVKAYLKALQNNDSQKVVELFHFSKEMSEKELNGYAQMIDEKVSKQNEKKQGIASYEIDEVVMAENEESAVVRYTIHYGDGTSQSDKQKVVKVNGKWLLDSGK